MPEAEGGVEEAWEGVVVHQREDSLSWGCDVDRVSSCHADQSLKMLFPVKVMRSSIVLRRRPSC